MGLWRKVYNFPHGFKGLYHVWRDEAQFPFQVFLVALAIVLALFLDVPPVEFLILITTLFLALGSEVINTAVEELCDKVEPGHHPHIGKIKDIAQAYVYVASVPAIIASAIILLPRLIALL